MLEIVEIQPCGSHANAFVSLKKEVYEYDTQATPSFPGRLDSALDDDHPFFGYGRAKRFLAIADGQPVARAVAYLNPRARDANGKRVGYIGHFEAHECGEAVVRIFDRAQGWLHAQGITKTVAPVDFSTWHSYRLRSWSSEALPFLLEPYNPDYYPKLFEACGFMPEYRYCSQWATDFDAIIDSGEIVAEKCRQKGFQVRCFRPWRLRSELKKLYQIATRTFNANPYYTDCDFSEFTNLYAGAVRLLPRDFLLFVCSPTGEEVAFAFAMPNLAPALRAMQGHKTVAAAAHFLWNRSQADTLIYKTVAVDARFRGMGLASWLSSVLHQSARRRGYRKSIHALYLDCNASQRLARGKSKLLREYTLYSCLHRGGVGRQRTSGGDKKPDPGSNLSWLVERRANSHPERSCLIIPEDGAGQHHHHVTYGELRQKIHALSAGFAQQGIGRGDAVVVLVGMSDELYAVLLALFRIGAVAAFIDPWMGPKGIERCAAKIEPKAFIASTAAQALLMTSPTLRKLRLRISTGRRFLGTLSIQQLYNSSAPTPDIAKVSKDTTALVTFTSGSSGQPKGSDRTHGHLLAQHRVLAATLGPPESAIDMPALPIFTLNTLAVGATAVIPASGLLRPAQVNAPAILRQWQQFGVEWTTASPAFYQPIVDLLIRQGGGCEIIKSLHTGGAPVSHALARGLVDLLGPERAKVVYGSTEAEPIAMLSAGEFVASEELTALGQGTCVGRVIEKIELALLPIHNGPLGGDSLKKKLSTGETGEVVVAGPHVNDRYYADEAAFSRNKICTDEGRIWHRTGDTGHLDKQHRLWIDGAVSSTIGVGKRSLHAVAVEECARSVNGVRRAALVASQRNEPVLIVETESWLGSLRPRYRRQLRAEIKHQLRKSRLDVAKIRFDPRLIVDSRHNSKVDRSKIKRRHFPTS